MTTQTQAADRHTVVATGWTNPSNAYATTGDNVYATGLAPKNGTLSGDFGFPSLGLPAGASIVACRLVVEWKLSASVTGGIAGIKGRNNGVDDSSAEVTFTSLTEAQSTFTFTDEPTAADLNTAGLVVARCRSSKGNTNTAMTVSIDFVRLEVDYIVVADGTLAVAGAGTMSQSPIAKYAGAVALTGTGALAVDGTVVPAGGGGGTTYAADDFNDAQTDSWGSLDTGGAWSNSGTASDYQKTGSEGTHSLATATTKQSRAASVAAGEQEGTIDLRASDITAASSQGIFWRIEARGAASFTDGYRFELRISGTGAVNVLLRKVAAGSATTLRTDSNVVTGAAAGDWLRFKWQIDDSGADVILRYKLWNTNGGSEPGSWSTDYTDVAPGSPFQSDGIFQLTSQVSANFTGSFPVVLSYRNLAITSIGGAGGTTQNGTLSITGTGALAQSPIETSAGSWSAAGAGTASFAGVETNAGALAVAGAGTMTETGALLLSSASWVQTGTGALGQSPKLTITGSIALAGAGLLAQTGIATYAGSLVVAGSGALAAALRGTYAGALSVAGSGLITLAGGIVQSATLALAGAGAIAWTPKATWAGALAPTGSGAVTWAVTGGGTVNGALSVAGSGVLAQAGTIVSAGALALVGVGTLGQAGSALLPGALAITGTGALAQTPRATLAGALVVAGSGAIVAAGILRLPGALAVTGVGTFVASAGGSTFGTLTLAGVGTLAQTAGVQRTASVDLTGVGTLVETPVAKLAGMLAPNGAGAMSVTGVLTARFTLALVGVGAVDLDSFVVPALGVKANVVGIDGPATSVIGGDTMTVRVSGGSSRVVAVEGTNG